MFSSRGVHNPFRLQFQKSIHHQNATNLLEANAAADRAAEAGVVAPSTRIFTGVADIVGTPMADVQCIANHPPTQGAHRCRYCVVFHAKTDCVPTNALMLQSTYQETRLNVIR